MVNAGVSESWPVGARFDDFVSGEALVLNGLRESCAAHDLDEVAALVAAAERHARDGAWVAMLVTYEAGPAFDAAQQVVPPNSGEPLAWFAAFDTAVGEPVIGPAGPVGVTVVGRRGGSQWFTEQVDRCKEVIADGDAYQINLTDRLLGRLEGDPTDLYARMARAQGGAFNALIRLGERTIVSASPELFFQVRGDTLSARPMKGTVARGIRPCDDEAAASWLLASDKDRAENVMITDLLRNDIGRVARIGSVRVPALFALERYETVWQLTSTVEGTIDDSVELVDIFRALFPCGSITGAPKVAAMRHITSIEPWPRGVYCGAVGLIRPMAAGEVRPSATFSVAIRTAVVLHGDSTVEYGAGCGITADSDACAEDRELEAKTAVFVRERPEMSLLETMRVVDGAVCHLSLHLARIEASSRYFGFAFDRDDVARRCVAAAELEGSDGVHRLRLLVDRSGSARVTVDPLGATTPCLSVALSRRRVPSHDLFMCHKTTHRVVYEAAALEHPDVDDVVLVNERDEVVESCRANVLYRIGDRWYTPPLSSGGLAGVGRRVLVESGEVVERVLTVDELERIDELQLVSALRGRRRAELKDGSGAAHR